MVLISISWLIFAITTVQGFYLLFTAGNKSDKVNQREIPLYVGEEFARRHEMKFIETSAKEAENVERLFMDIAKELIRQTKANEIQPHYEEEINPAGSTPVTVMNNCCSRLS